MFALWFRKLSSNIERLESEARQAHQLSARVRSLQQELFELEDRHAALWSLIAPRLGLGEAALEQKLAQRREGRSSDSVRTCVSCGRPNHPSVEQCKYCLAPLDPVARS